MSDQGLVGDQGLLGDELEVEHFRGALELIADAAPELMQYILTYYPPEEMLHISPELCQRLELQKKQLSPQELNDLRDFLSNL